MAFPQSGLIKIFPDTVSIPQGSFSLNSDAAPQPVRTPAAIEAYFDARVTNLAVAPCLRRETEKPAASGIYVPSGGNYELQFSPSSRGMEFYDGAYAGAPVATLDFLDANFPMGMTLNQAVLYWTGQVFLGPSRDREITQIKYNYFGSNFYTYTPGLSGVLLTGSNSSPATGANAIIPSLLTQWSIIQLMRTFGITIPVATVVSALANTPRAVTSECFLLATYNTQSFDITTTTPDVLPGSDVVINSAGGLLEDLDPDEYKIYWDTLPGEEDANPLFPGWAGGVRIPRYLIFELTPYTLHMRLQGSGIPYGGRRLMLTGTGNGTIFVGEFPLQNFNTTLVDGSGLYKLVDSQRHDTYYDRGTSPVETIDLKIPDPNIKTGYFNA